ncbi:carbohydrate ABC transporter permease [Kiloniella sp.]|uniref:carbohydrate ABC transporter permease n=1 Tax=Kiloniella sp. TaxID=1938587 RepID=UPI003B0176DC
MALKTKRGSSFRTHVLVFLLPAALIYTLFMILPLIDTVRFSFYSQESGGPTTFVGWDNYILILTDERWWKDFTNALENNFVFFAVHMLIQNPIGLLLAALLSLPRLKLANSYRTLIFMPTMLSVVIIGFIWKLILSPLWGVGDTLVGFVGMTDGLPALLGEESTALITLSLISVWQFVGIPMMLIYAALLNVPDDLVDAAIVDGANQWTAFWRIKLPLILPTVAMVSVLTFVANFNAFDLIYAVKGALAGPDFHTDIMGTLFYRTFFGFQLQPGSATMGATVASLMFLVILCGVMIYLFVIQRRLHRYQL